MNTLQTANQINGPQVGFAGPVNIGTDADLICSRQCPMCSELQKQNTHLAQSLKACLEALDREAQECERREVPAEQCAAWFQVRADARAVLKEVVR